MARILVCDDDMMMLKTLEHRLKGEGYEVVAVKDGKEASDLISRALDSFDIIITDMLMPFVSGLEIINLVRVQFQSQIPLLVLSRVGNEDTVLQAFDLGADDYLTKPFSPNELSIRVKKALRRR